MHSHRARGDRAQEILPDPRAERSDDGPVQREATPGAGVGAPYARLGAEPRAAVDERVEADAHGGLRETGTVECDERRCIRRRHEARALVQRPEAAGDAEDDLRAWILDEDGESLRAERLAQRAAARGEPA